MIPVQAMTPVFGQNRSGMTEGALGPIPQPAVDHDDAMPMLGKSLEWHPEGLEELVLMLDDPSRIQKSSKMCKPPVGLGVCVRPGRATRAGWVPVTERPTLWASPYCKGAGMVADAFGSGPVKLPRTCTSDCECCGAETDPSLGRASVMCRSTCCSVAVTVWPETKPRML